VALETVVMVSVEDDDAGFGLKLPVMPLRRPLTLMVTGLLKPFVPFTVTA
jgi:hypothetical protein